MEPPDRGGASLAWGALECQPRGTAKVVKGGCRRRVPARERSVAVTEQQGETESRRGGRMAHRLAKADKQAIGRAFGTRQDQVRARRY